MRLLRALRQFLAARPTTADRLWRYIGYAIAAGLIYDGLGYAVLGGHAATGTGLAVLRALPGLQVHGAVELVLGIALWHRLARGRRGRVVLAGVVGYMLFATTADFASWWFAVPGHFTPSWSTPGRPGGLLILALILAFTIPVDPGVAPRQGRPGDGAR